MKKDITRLFCLIDDFESIGRREKEEADRRGEMQRKPTRIPDLTESEIETIG